MKYSVKLNLNRDCVDYNPGDTVDLPDDVAADLLAAGVVTTDEAERPVVEAPAPEPEKEADPVVGGDPVVTGEPNLDAQNAPAPVSVAAEDVTPIATEDDPSANL